MAESISNIILARLSELISSHMGLHFPTERWPDIQRGIRSAASDFGFKDTESCASWLVSSPLTKNQIEILASHIAVGETCFFRDKPIFEALENHILRELVRSRRKDDKRLRIWSAGCATGEEPYSIAILLSRMIPDIKDWNVTILATDINSRFLEKASKGLYREWSFRNTPPKFKEKYFKRSKESSFRIFPHIKKMVRFSYHNLAEDTYPSLLNDTNAMDVIFCKNVIMYFDPERQRRVIQNLYNCLVDGGRLVVSPCETSHILFSQFETVNFPDTILYRKTLHKKDRRRVRQAQDFETTVPFHEHRTPVDLSFEVQPPACLPVQTDPAQPPDASQKQQEPEPPPVSEPRLTPFEEALTLYQQGRYTEAAEKLASSQDDNKSIALLARAYANQGKLTDALEWCEKAVVTDKLNPGFHYLRATILQEQGRIKEAMTSLKRTLYLDPDFVLAHFALGNLARQQGKLKESVRHLSNAVMILQSHDQAEVLPESDGVTAGRLAEIISCMAERETRV